jgi:hypothetical protein
VAQLAQVSASQLAMATERWRPPVQPTAMFKYDFPSRSYCGTENLQQVVYVLQVLVRDFVLEHIVDDRRAGAVEVADLAVVVGVGQKSKVKN